MHNTLKFLGKPLSKAVGHQGEGLDRQSSGVAWLHYPITSGLFLFFSIIVTLENLLLKEKKFNCMYDDKDDDDDKVRVMVHYCYMRGGFTDGKTGQPGAYQDDVSTRWNSYYIWVPVVLIFQAVLFYIPRVLLKMWHHPLLQDMQENLRQALVCRTDEEAVSKRDAVAKYLARTLNKNNSWAMKMLVIEFAYLVNPIFNFFFMDYFLQGEFLTYGADVANYTINGGEVSPMDRVFPIMSKCTFHKYGPSGSIEVKDLLCVLPMNVVNSKIYLILWYWLHFLIAITALYLVTSLVLTFSTSACVGRLRKFCGPRMSKLIIGDLRERLQHGDWRLLLLLGQMVIVIDRKTFAELVEDLWQYSGRNRYLLKEGMVDGNQNHETEMTPLSEQTPDASSELESRLRTPRQPVVPQHTAM